MSNHQLTHKQEKFILAVVEGMTQADAYRHAYNASNMSSDTIINKASKLMARDDIRARYNELIDKVRKSAEDKAIVTVEDVLQSILKIREVCMQPITLRSKDTNEILGQTIHDTTGALKANEMLGKTLKMFTDKLEHSGEIKMPTVIIE